MDVRPIPDCKREGEGFPTLRAGAGAADATPSRNAEKRVRHYYFMHQGGCRPSAAAGAKRDGIKQAVAAITEGTLKRRQQIKGGGNRSDITPDPGRPRPQQHCLAMITSRTRPEEVIPQKGHCQRDAQTRDTRAIKQQVITVVPSVFPGRLESPNTEGKTWTWQRVHAEPTAVWPHGLDLCVCVVDVFLLKLLGWGAENCAESAGRALGARRTHMTVTYAIYSCMHAQT